MDTKTVTYLCYILLLESFAQTLRHHAYTQTLFLPFKFKVLIYRLTKVQAEHISAAYSVAMGRKTNAICYFNILNKTKGKIIQAIKFEYKVAHCHCIY